MTGPGNIGSATPASPRRSKKFLLLVREEPAPDLMGDIIQERIENELRKIATAKVKATKTK
jgi:hypothetical protein